MVPLYSGTSTKNEPILQYQTLWTLLESTDFDKKQAWQLPTPEWQV